MGDLQRETLDLGDVPIVDAHAHPLLHPAHVATDADFVLAFTEGRRSADQLRQAPATLFFQRSLRDLGELFDCAPELPAIFAARSRLTHDELTARCFAAANVEQIVLDDGFDTARTLRPAWHEQFAQVRRVERVEALVERLIPESLHFDELAERFRAALATVPAGTVGFKSIVAYRTGLAVAEPARPALRAAFERAKRASERGPLRLADKPLNDWVVLETFRHAAHTGWPVQFHTGWGDPDLDLRLAGPLHLRPLLEAEAFRAVPVVLLHGAYPFMRHAGYLAAVYPNVQIDLGLSIPFLSVDGMRCLVREVLELAPVGKLQFSTDAHAIPELYYLGARWGRRVISAELARAVANGDLTRAFAERAGRAILRDNALRTYGVRGQS